MLVCFTHWPSLHLHFWTVKVEVLFFHCSKVMGYNNSRMHARVYKWPENNDDGLFLAPLKHITYIAQHVWLFSIPVTVWRWIGPDASAEYSMFSSGNVLYNIHFFSLWIFQALKQRKSQKASQQYNTKPVEMLSVSMWWVLLTLPKRTIALEILQ